MFDKILSGEIFDSSSKSLNSSEASLSEENYKLLFHTTELTWELVGAIMFHCSYFDDETIDIFCAISSSNKKKIIEGTILIMNNLIFFRSDDGQVKIGLTAYNDIADIIEEADKKDIPEVNIEWFLKNVKKKYAEYIRH